MIRLFSQIAFRNPSLLRKQIKSLDLNPNRQVWSSSKTSYLIFLAKGLPKLKIRTSMSLNRTLSSPGLISLHRVTMLISSVSRTTILTWQLCNSYSVTTLKAKPQDACRTPTMIIGKKLWSTSHLKSKKFKCCIIQPRRSCLESKFTRSNLYWKLVCPSTTETTNKQSKL